jgi:hypothetical protein
MPDLHFVYFYLVYGWVIPKALQNALQGYDILRSRLENSSKRIGRRWHFSGLWNSSFFFCLFGNIEKVELGDLMQKTR